MPSRRSRKRVWIHVLVAVLAFKCFVFVGMLPRMKPFSSVDVEPSSALAQSPRSAEVSPPEPRSDRSRDEFLRSLRERRYEQLKAREKQIRAAEEKARREEERLGQVKADIAELLKEFQTLKKQVDAIIKKREEADQEKLKRLARVYQEAPPEKAGPMLSKLPPKMAARILILINPRKAGKIWGQVDPESAEKISKELVNLKE